MVGGGVSSRACIDLLWLLACGARIQSSQVLANGPQAQRITLDHDAFRWRPVGDRAAGLCPDPMRNFAAQLSHEQVSLFVIAFGQVSNRPMAQLQALGWVLVGAWFGRDDK